MTNCGAAMQKARRKPDVGLLPEKSFKEVLEECEKNPEAFTHDVGQLWEAMDLGTWAHVLKTKVKKFNGEFFKNRAALPLGREEIGELRQAATYNWNEVDPSIFGTLLEQALDPNERERLGAHYTPRAYVERLVLSTIIEPLRMDWQLVVATADNLRQQAEELARLDRRAADDLFKGARQVVRNFHEKICLTRVLDPMSGRQGAQYANSKRSIGCRRPKLGLHRVAGVEDLFGGRLNRRPTEVRVTDFGDP